MVASLADNRNSYLILKADRFSGMRKRRDFGGTALVPSKETYTAKGAEGGLGRSRFAGEIKDRSVKRNSSIDLSAPLTQAPVRIENGSNRSTVVN